MRKSIAATNIACNAVTALANDGSTFSSGFLNLYNSDSTIVARLPLTYPVSFQDSTDGTAFSNQIFDATAFMDATIATYDVTDRDLVHVWDGAVSTFSGYGDVKLPSLVVTQDSTISISVGFYAVPR